LNGQFLDLSVLIAFLSLCSFYIKIEVICWWIRCNAKYLLITYFTFSILVVDVTIRPLRTLSCNNFAKFLPPELFIKWMIHGGNNWLHHSKFVNEIAFNFLFHRISTAAWGSIFITSFEVFKLFSVSSLINIDITPWYYSMNFGFS